MTTWRELGSWRRGPFRSQLESIHAKRLQLTWNLLYINCFQERGSLLISLASFQR
jgi:hypothetical protein